MKNYEQLMSLDFEDFRKRLKSRHKGLRELLNDFTEKTGDIEIVKFYDSFKVIIPPDFSEWVWNVIYPLSYIRFYHDSATLYFGKVFKEICAKYPSCTAAYYSPNPNWSGSLNTIWFKSKSDARKFKTDFLYILSASYSFGLCRYVIEKG